MNHSETIHIGRDLLFQSDGLRLTGVGFRVHTQSEGHLQTGTDPVRQNRQIENKQFQSDAGPSD